MCDVVQSCYSPSVHELLARCRYRRVIFVDLLTIILERESLVLAILIPDWWLYCVGDVRRSCHGTFSVCVGQTIVLVKSWMLFVR